MVHVFPGNVSKIFGQTKLNEMWVGLLAKYKTNTPDIL
jgi:hypothetical protein